MLCLVCCVWVKGSAASADLLEAIQYARENISPAEWNRWLQSTDVDPCDNHLLDRLFSKLPVQKDISLPAILSLCKDVEKTLPPNGDFNEACRLAISEQLQQEKHAQLILEKVLTFHATHEPAPIFAAHKPSIVSSILEPALIFAAHEPAIALDAQEPNAAPSSHQDTVLISDGLDIAANQLDDSQSTQDERERHSPLSTLNALCLGSLSSPQVCLNLSQLPYGDWVYYTSLPSAFQPLLHRRVQWVQNEESISRQGLSLFTAQPHYTFASADLGRSTYKQSTPGISLQGGKALTDHWILSWMVDYGRSSSHWHPLSSRTSDSTNRWSAAPSVTYYWKKAYIQLMVLGSYNRSSVHNTRVCDSVGLRRWGVGSRLDGGINIDVSGTSKYWLQPYLCLDYLATFQQSKHSPHVVYVKRATFFRSQGVLQFFGKFYPTPKLCVIPQAGAGFTFATSLSKTTQPIACDVVPEYPNWNALTLNGGVVFLLKRGLEVGVRADVTLCRSVQVYNGNITLGWNW
jgi:hypothetical protein